MIAPGVIWRFLGCMVLLAAPWFVAAHIAPRNGLPLAVLFLGVLAILFIPTRARAQAARDRVPSGSAQTRAQAARPRGPSGSAQKMDPLA